MKIVVYRDLPDDGHTGFEYFGDHQNPTTQVVAQGKIPGKFGKKDIHIQHFIHPEFLLVTQAYRELNGVEVGDIITQAKLILPTQNN